ncbi:glycerol-3-phosphate responsive antiterminator, partial [Escherichia albertii]|uniref:glycerol-3-phosphate responsive antiterminator n=1 Tax=Escherichia albertii TaxID=208962 RepID=UPI001F0203D8
ALFKQKLAEYLVLYNSKRPHKALALMTPVEYILRENKNCNMWWTHTPDCIEILPGCMLKVLGWVTEKIRQPLIAGGLVCDEEDARNAINAGVVALSTTNTGVWTLAKKLL